MDEDEKRAALRLAGQLRRQRQECQTLLGYYRADRVLSFIAPEVLLEMGDRLRPVRVSWPAIAIDRLNERLDVEGFRIADDLEADGSLWGFWQRNNLDLGSQMAHLDALRFGRGYVVGAVDVDGQPVLTVESPLELTAEWSVSQRRVAAAFKEWREPDKTRQARMWLPGRRIALAFDGRGWVETGRDEYDDLVPVEVIANRVTTDEPMGSSEITPAVMDLTDAVTKLLTDMMVAAEYHAVPMRAIFGARSEDFADADGNPIDVTSALMGKALAIPDPAGKLATFQQTDLRNFHESVNLLAHRFAAEVGLPPQYLGISNDNPASADAIRAMEAALVERAQSRQRAFGEAWERVMRMAVRIAGGDPSGMEGLETLWADPGTPTRAQAADAAVKLVGAGVIPPEQAQEDLGYSVAARERMAAWRDGAAARILGGDLIGAVGPTPEPGDVAGGL